MPFAATPDTLSGAAYTLAVATCDESWLDPLTPREQHEYDELPHAARRPDWLAGRCAAKRAIAARWAITADQIELTPVPGSAPRPSVRNRTGGCSSLPARLTIAHRDGLAIAAAFPSTASIGVDIEREGELSPMELRYFASASERSRHDGVDATLVWILKEAAWKALGLGPSAPLSSLQLVFGDNQRELIAVRHGTRELPARAAVARVSATRSMIAALVEIAPEGS